MSRTPEPGEYLRDPMPAISLQPRILRSVQRTAPGLGVRHTR